MATYSPEQLGIKPPAGGFQQGGWYSGRQYWGGTLSDPNVEHPSSGKPSSGQPVSAEVRAQSAAAQGVSPQQFDQYLQSQGASQQQLPGAGQTSAGVSTPGFSAASKPSTPDLLAEYEKFLQSPEVTENQKKADDIQAKIIEEERIRDENIGDVRNNPWMAEGITGSKIAEASSLAQRKINTFLKEKQQYDDKVAQAKSDAQIKYNIKRDQYTLDMQSYQQTLDQFTSYLQLGAFENSSGADIAQWASATGIPSSMIQNMVKTQKTKNLSVQTYDDGSNVYTIALDPEGNVVNKTLIGNSKPSGTSSSDLKIYEQQQTYSNAAADIQSGITLKDLVRHYSQPGGLTVEQLYFLYNTANSPYGAAKESLDEVKAGTFLGDPGYVGR